MGKEWRFDVEGGVGFPGVGKGGRVANGVIWKFPRFIIVDDR